MTQPTSDALKAITGAQHLPYQSPQWQTLFSAARELEERELDYGALQKYGARFVASNLNSRNLMGLILHASDALLRAQRHSKIGREFTDEERTERDAEYSSCRVRLLLCRVFLQYFIEHLKQDVLSLHLSGWPDELSPTLFNLPEGGVGVPQALMKSLVSFLVGVPVAHLTYPLHEELLTLMIVLFSAQMFNGSVRDPSLFLDMLVDEGEYFGGAAFVSKMFSNIETRYMRPLTQHESDRQRQAEEEKSSDGMLRRIVSYGANVMLLPLRAFEWLLQSSHLTGLPMIANYSTLILLQIANCRRSSHFSDAFTLAHDRLQTPEPSAFEEDFGRLFDAFCSSLDHDPHVLLFYYMLHRNNYFRRYIESRTDLDSLLLPLLKHLYKISDRDLINPQQVYMILIVLLLMSQQDGFGANCRLLPIGEVDWYKDQVLLDCSLADVIVAVLVRTVMLNLTRLQDGYLHTNCLAILANMANSAFSKLHFHSAERLMALLSFLHKRLSQAQTMVVGSAEDPVLHIVVDSHSGIPQDEDLSGMISLYENLTSILFEVLQTVVSHSVKQNTGFIYALLHSRVVLETMSKQPRWQGAVTPLLCLVYHFDPLINLEESQTIDKVMETIQRGIINWPVPAGKGILKFGYTEADDASTSFFLPYSLSLVYRHTNLRFNHSRITMFAMPEWQDYVAEKDGEFLGLVVET